MRSQRVLATLLLSAAALVLWLVAGKSLAHCDTMDGPIVPEAQNALASGDVTPVLKWVRPQDEAAILDEFDRARAVRSRGEDVRQIADQLFLETLIRIHRAGEGEPYTGLKPAGSAPPIFASADAALDAGSVDELADEVSQAVRAEVKRRFDVARERRQAADSSVEAGRAYVQAYVEYMHFLEGLHAFLEHGAAPAHHGSKAAGH